MMMAVSVLGGRVGIQGFFVMRPLGVCCFGWFWGGGGVGVGGRVSLVLGDLRLDEQISSNTVTPLLSQRAQISLYVVPSLFFF